MPVDEDRRLHPQMPGDRRGAESALVRGGWDAEQYSAQAPFTAVAEDR